MTPMSHTRAGTIQHYRDVMLRLAGPPVSEILDGLEEAKPLRQTKSFEKPAAQPLVPFTEPV